MTIFAGGSLALASGITGAGRQMSVAFCAIAVIAYNTMAATYSRDVPFEFVYFSFAISFLPCVHRIASLADAVNVAAFFLTNSCTLIGPCPVSVSTLSDSRS